MELIGAKASIYQCSKPLLVGLEGIIVAQTSSCFHFLHNKFTGAAWTPLAPNQKPKINAHYLASHKVVKVARSDATLAVFLPQKKEKGSTEEVEGDGADVASEEVAGETIIADSTTNPNWVSSIGSHLPCGKVMLLFGKRCSASG